MEYGLVGEKLRHSFSKIIHNKLYSAPYELKEIPQNEVKEFMLKRDFKGINVTIPYKETVIPFLDVISDNAKQIGAVNTVVNKGGKLYGYNTDFLGLKELITHNNIEIKGKKVLILGSGGTSKTAKAVAECLDAKQIFCLSRKGGKGLITYNEALKNHRDAEIIINTTPCGMYPNIGESAIDISNFPQLEGVVDVVYNPLSSALVVEARNKKIKAIGGLYMLVSQAVFAAEFFLDTVFDRKKIDEIYKTIENEKKNIVLIGMPGVGKTTIGKELAKALDKEFVDTDDEIVKKEAILIPEIFATKGEGYFRQLESEVIKEISAKQGLVIATGGGAILNSLNIDLLKENGTVYFLDRNVEDIVATSDRPLSSNREDLLKRYEERYPIYLSSADFKVNCTSDVQKNIKEVILLENSNY
ncbi:MAG: shikimate dehydrogenase [Clostridia bacterium]|nr:shikimate dehydrogenase [Clostridia bacterium]